MIRESKIWGERWLIRLDSLHANSILHIKKGFRCSWHCHQTKHNIFLVISGRISILVKVDDSVSEVELIPGNEYSIAPGVWHEFRAHEDSVVLEEMYVTYNEQDINRETVGGKF